MVHVLPDEIRSIQDKEINEQIKVCYDYIKYMRESIDFWGNNRSREIDTAINLSTRDISIRLENGMLRIIK